MCRASGRVGAHSAALALVVALASAAARAASGGGGGGARGWRAALAAHEPWQRAARRHVPDGPWARERGVFDPSDKHPLEDLNPPPPHPVASFDVGGLGLGLRRGSRTVQTLTIVGDMRWGRNFSFVPPLWNFWPPKRHRDQPGAHHLGDLTVRVQPANETNASIWATYSSAWSGDSVDVEQTDTCVTSGVAEEALLDCSDVTAALTARPRSQIDARWPLSLRVVRSYERAADGRGGLIIRWRVENNATSGGSMRIGGLGFSIVPDATWGGLNLTHVAAGLSFADAYAGGSRGSLMWNRADGSASLLITPADAVGHPTQLEAYRPILEDTAAVQWGTYEWTVHSAAWASEWASNRQAPFMSMVDDENHRRAWPRPRSPWPCWQGNETFYKPNPQLLNAPTDVVLAPGESREYALRLSLVENGPRGRAQALLAAGEPVLRGTPGFVIPTDVEGAALHVWPPAGAKVISVKSDDTSMLVVQPGTIGKTLSDAPHTSYSVRGIKRGRVTLRVHFSDGTWASVHYYVLPPLDGLVRQFGNFSANVAWLPADFKDPFGRSASVMPWDREDKTHVLQDARPFVVGLSDDAGGGATLGLATKVAYAPTALEASRLDDYVALTLDGVKPHTAMPPLFSLQDMSNDTRRVDRILMTLFYWNHSNLPASYYTENAKCPLFPSWCSFNERTATSPASWINVYRQYNFPHQIAVFWALYRAARHQRGGVGAILRHSWDWYLGRACDTIFALGCCAYPDANRQCTCVPGVGLMDGTVFREVLVSLEREGWGEWAALVRSMMYNRTAVGVGDGTRGWLHSDAPFGSEFNWDTTGQEEVGVWGEYFGVSSSGWWGTDVPLGARVADAVLAYTPSMPNWQLHGSAAGWGDFSNNGKWMITGGWEREGGHYRAGLNSIPLLERFRRNPDDVYLLEVGIGGVSAVLPNIDPDGAPSMAFHTYPFVSEHDPRSGDYGLAFFGHAMGAGSYLVYEPDLGRTLCFLCDVEVDAVVQDAPREGDAGRPRESGGPRADLLRLSSQEPVGVLGPQLLRARVSPRDSFRRRLYVGHAGVDLRLLTGVLLNATVDTTRSPALIALCVGDAPETAGSASDVLLEVSLPGGAARGVDWARVVPASASAPPVRYEAGMWAVPVETGGVTRVTVEVGRGAAGAGGASDAVA